MSIDLEKIGNDLLADYHSNREELAKTRNALRKLEAAVKYVNLKMIVEELKDHGHMPSALSELIQEAKAIIKKYENEKKV
jgi:hypothetical protein